LHLLLGEVPERATGDHVIPQLLGKFRPEIMLKNVCRDCDSHIGATAEKALARGGLTGWFRLLNGIKSAQSKRKDAYNPLTDAHFGFKSNWFDVYLEKDGQRVRPYVLPDGKIYSLCGLISLSQEIRSVLNTSIPHCRLNRLPIFYMSELNFTNQRTSLTTYHKKSVLLFKTSSASAM
jgi:hypothetical protein